MTVIYERLANELNRWVGLGWIIKKEKPQTSKWAIERLMKNHVARLSAVLPYEQRVYFLVLICGLPRQ